MNYAETICEIDKLYAELDYYYKENYDLKFLVGKQKEQIEKLKKQIKKLKEKINDTSRTTKNLAVK